MTIAHLARQTAAPHVRTRLGRGGLLFAALLLAAPPALADARSEAKRHYRTGLDLLAQGKLERAIESFKSAYAIKPHPDALYNIARAYLDLANIPEAINYFKRYVASDPEDRASVEQVIGRLSSAIAPKPEAKPVEEKPPEEEPKPPEEQAAAPMDAAALLAKLQEMINASKGAPAPQKPKPTEEKKPEPPKPQEPPDEFEATEIAAQSKATVKEISAELAGSMRAQQAEDVFEEQVVTAGVRATTEEKTPASITIIGEEEIRLSGASTIPEILRRVPGIDVAEMNPSDVNISFRGLNRRISNKVLVLVDGRSTYQDFLGITLWPLLNIAIHDISRIEVVRGPGSALYGANAFTGVVNIITKTGEEAAGARGWFQGGSHNTVQGGVSVGGRTGRFSYRTSLGYDRADKWSRDQVDDLPAWTPQFTQTNRSREVQRADLVLGYDAGRTQITVAGGFNDFSTEIFPNGAIRTFGAEGQAGFARFEAAAGSTKVKAFWNSLRMKAGPEYWPDGIRKFNTSVRSDVIDVQAQTGFEFKLAGHHEVSLGAGYRYKTVDWTYLRPKEDGGTRYDENHFNLFLQEDWQPHKRVNVILSYRVDRHPLLASGSVTTGGLVHSPRGSVLYSLNRDNTLRATVGTSFRASTFFESYIGVVSPVPNQPALGVAFDGDRKLLPESMIQGELGYRGRFLDNRVQAEVVGYVQRIYNLIIDSALKPSTPDTARDPRTGDYIIGFAGFESSKNVFYGFGAELGGKWSPVDGLDLGFNYSFERMADCTSGCTFSVAKASLVSALLTNVPQHKINGTLVWRTRRDFDISVDAHYVSGVTWTENTFEPFNPEAVGGILFTPYTLSGYMLINGRVGYRIIKDKLEVGLSVYNLLGDEHREHPFGNVIGRRVMLTASGAF